MGFRTFDPYQKFESPSVVFAIWNFIGRCETPVCFSYHEVENKNIRRIVIVFIC